MDGDATDGEIREALKETMDEHVLPAVRSEVQKMAAGVRDSMAILGSLIVAGGKIKRSAFIDAAQTAAKALRAEGNEYAAQMLEGMCRRM